MTKEEAIVAIKSGKKITHRYFEDHEYVTITDDGQMLFENGSKQSWFEFWSLRPDSCWNMDWDIKN